MLHMLMGISVLKVRYILTVDTQLDQWLQLSGTHFALEKSHSSGACQGLQS